MKYSMVTTIGIAALVMAGICRPARPEKPEPIETTVCELVTKPEQFSGRAVVLRANLINPRRMALTDEACGRVLLAFPNDDEVRPKTTFELIEDEAFEKLMDSVAVLIPVPPKLPGRITGTFEGRFDSVFVLRSGRKIRRDPRSMRLAADEVRLVLRRVSNLHIEPPGDPEK